MTTYLPPRRAAVRAWLSRQRQSLKRITRKEALAIIGELADLLAVATQAAADGQLTLDELRAIANEAAELKAAVTAALE